MKRAHSKCTATSIKMDRVLSSEVIALQHVDSASQHSRPGQPATPDQVLPFLNAASLQSYDAAALWCIGSRNLSASPSKPLHQPEALEGAFSTPSGHAEEPKLSREPQHAQSANQWIAQLADMCPDRQLRGTAQKVGHIRLPAPSGAQPGLQQEEAHHHQGGHLHSAGRLTEGLQASEHSAAQTEISQSAEDEVMHCCDSIASALAPLVQAHVRSKPGLPAEVTDDSEDLSNSASEKVWPHSTMFLPLALPIVVCMCPLTQSAISAVNCCSWNLLHIRSGATLCRSPPSLGVFCHSMSTAMVFAGNATVSGRAESCLRGAPDRGCCQAGGAAPGSGAQL